MNGCKKLVPILLACLSLWRPAAATDRDADFKRGVQLYAQNDYVGALKEFQASGGRKDEGITHAAICLAQIHLGNFPDAITNYKLVYSQLSADGNGSHSEKEIMVPTMFVTLFDKEPNHYAVIKPFIDAFLIAEPSSLLAYKLLAIYGFEAGQREPLQLAISKLKTLEPNTPEIQAFQGILFALNNNVPEAKQAFAEALRLDPNFSMAKGLVDSLDKASEKQDETATPIASKSAPTSIFIRGGISIVLIAGFILLTIFRNRKKA